MRLQHLLSWLRPPQLVRVEAGPVVLPAGRTAAFVELTGWGVLSLEGRRRFFRGAVRLKVVIAADRDVELRLWSPFGRSRHVLRIASTTSAMPARAPSPTVSLPLLNARPSLAARVDTGALSPTLDLTRLSPPRGS